MPRKVFTAGEVLASADVNTYLMDQSVMTFAGSAARGSAIGSATEGMVTYLADSDSFEFWNGTSYVPLAPTTPTVEYLVIAGGGAGSLRATGQGAGGGGAGGYRTNVSGELSGGSVVAELPMPLVAGTYPITVGAGGAGTPTDNDNGAVGSYSAFANIVCVGGAWGITFGRLPYGFLGGSGGGGYQDSGYRTGGGPVPQQGFKGGDGVSAQTGGAGGGGAGATGVTVTSASGSAGGAGLSSTIQGGSPVTRAGGGGGGGASGSGGAGGAGGGGAGSIDNATAGNGTANTGSGGGGGETGTSGNGGSGVVIFSVPTTTTVTFSGGVTQTNSTVSGRQVYVVTNTTTTSETVTFS
jgi:hypothetical protein